MYAFVKQLTEVASDTGDCNSCEYGYWGFQCLQSCSPGCAENPSLLNLFNSSDIVYPLITPTVIGMTPLCDFTTGTKFGELS